MNGYNVLFLFSDEHRQDALVKTPNLDRLAKQRTMCLNTCTPSPICVPARAVHTTRCWSNARWKYNVYPGYDYELFDMESDPGALTNLANNPDYTDALKDCEQQMQSILDPQEQNRRAFSDQSEMIKKLGGVDSIVNSDEFDFTPVEK